VILYRGDHHYTRIANPDPESRFDVQEQLKKGKEEAGKKKAIETFAKLKSKRKKK
jgi:hypothetical protein